MPRPSVRSGKPGRRWLAMAAAGGVLAALAAVGWLGRGYSVELYRQARSALDVSAATVRSAAGEASGFFMTHPYFAIREVKVEGVDKVKGAELVVMSGLGPYTGIWSIDPAAIEERVRRHPWIKSVLVRRELPGRLVIDIEEWSASAIVALDKLYYVADDGVIFKALDDEDSVDFPFITGLRAARLPPREPGTRKKLSQAVALGRKVEQVPLGLSEIRFESGGGIVLYPVSYAVPFRMGWGDWDEKLTRMRWFLRKFEGKGARFRAVDLSFRGQVVARPRGKV